MKLTWKNLLWERAFLKPFFSFEKIVFKVSAWNFCHFKPCYWLKNLCCLSANQNPNLGYPKLCTGDNLFALVSHLKYTPFSQSESSNFFMHIIFLGNIGVIIFWLGIDFIGKFSMFPCVSFIGIFYVVLIDAWTANETPDTTKFANMHRIKSAS